MAHLEVENEKLKRQIEGLQGLLIVAKDCTNNQKAEIKERDELLDFYYSGNCKPFRKECMGGPCNMECPVNDIVLDKVKKILGK